MVPQRSLVTITSAVLLLIVAGAAQAPQPKSVEKQVVEAKPVPAATKETPEPEKPAGPKLENKPYAIRAFIAFDSTTRIDIRMREQILDEWRRLAGRMVGPIWDVKIAESDGPASASRTEDLTADDLRTYGNDVDKLWVIQARAAGSVIELHARELDVATGWLGSHHERTVLYLGDIARDLFRLTTQIFAPYAEIGEPKGDVVPLRVQASALPRGLGADLIAAPGSIFRPIRVYLKEDGSRLNIEKIYYSYLRVIKHEGSTIETSLIRGVRDPLTKRISRKNKLIAVGVKPAPMPTRLKFIKLPDKSPAAGYVLSYRQVPEGLFREIATTDREGRVNIAPGFADSLVIFRLTAGKAEPMFDLPVMPGELDEELTIPFDPKPHAITVHAQLDALRDTILDLVAVRSRLERRMKARELGDDWAGVEEALVEFRKLTPKDVYAKRLEVIQDDATRLEAKLKTTVMTKNVRGQIADTKSMIDRYLDDETFRAYEDAVERSKQRDAKGKVIKPAAKPAAAQKTPTPANPIAAPAPKPATKGATGKTASDPF